MIRLVIKIVKHPREAILSFIELISPLIPDKLYLKIVFSLRMRKKLNLRNPMTYSEKLQWLKLYDRKPFYSKLVDKYEVKQIVADSIGEEFVIPTLGIWDNFEEIDFDKLPNQFVIKCTHDSGGLVICRDKNSLDIESARQKINKSLKRKYYFHAREWPYKNVKPRIIVEKYLEDETGELRDYKFFCFNGKAKAMFIATDRSSNTEETKFDFFDMNFGHLPFTQGHPNTKQKITKPVCFKAMAQLAEKLSQNLPQVRVDFYEVKGAVYFGEITLFHYSGMTPFNPPDWDRMFGEWVVLPKSE